MYQSFVYLETRILLAPVASVFVKDRALGCSIPDTAVIEHLTGNLPEPPAGKKISGYSVKVAEGGSLDIMFHSRPKTIHVEEVRLEEDSGHMTHADGQTRMDFTWAGSPSIRLRTTPAFELGEEAELFLNELRRLTQYLSLVNREVSEGSIRSNAFVALSKYPELPIDVKLRNLNSFNFVRKAVNFELTRQENILSSGGIIASESRLWNEKQSRTESYQSRSSELRRFELLDPPVRIDMIRYARAAAGEEKTELPQQRRERFRRQYGVSRLRAEFLCDEKGRADFLTGQ